MSGDVSKRFPPSSGLVVDAAAARAIGSAQASGGAGAAGHAAHASCSAFAPRESLVPSSEPGMRIVSIANTENTANTPNPTIPKNATTTTTAPPSALAGLKVIDLSRVLGGPYCTQALADHGARVIKIEPPTGDETRGWGPPFFDDDAWYFIGVNRNKEGIALDLSRDEGRAILWRLLEDADVLVENFKPGTLARWGMDYERDLRARFPRLIHCAITGFGADGPLGGLPGYDAVIQAMAGLMSVNGDADGDATRIGLPIVDMVTGLNALAGILLALAEREKSGAGQSIDIALYDCGVSLLHPHLPNWFGSGRTPARSGNAHPNIAPYDSYRTASAPIFLAVGNDRQFARLCAHLGVPSLASDPRFVDNRSRCAHRAELKARLEARLAEHDCETLARELMGEGVPCGPVRTVDAVARDPHTLHRALVVEMGRYRGAASPIKLSRTPATYRVAPPSLGRDTRAVLDALGIDAATQARLAEAGVLKEAT
ncbi:MULTISPECIES: CaiB/BaiF CoA transferase family protein [Burkholderia]|uniref:CaiB/BaiF CoA transferase family protein n=1 Tax=Burkholderia TaxID=32008 RepID=UPI00075D9285|nr:MULTISPECIES: CoA transferase [Burkholderia]AOJ68322.1 CoA-transferase [Burkholderia savannae]KVG41892.1 CoA-transferase [Burkholderia sp. MSMB0265]KVG86477.1 CoA-transferase [Burkholderia sp. MSMB2040]KVG98694.1 CoA-transferase [Burkholderia sp. MSMB2041]KVG99489.1 CoA-transferase [Burkholderia sp. MSMB2042]